MSKIKLPIYMDYMATTPLDPAVLEAMKPCLDLEGCFGNPASHTHRYGYEAAELVKKAREQVAALLNADPREIVWTSGATEADNLAIKGAAEFYQRKGKHIITMSTEHKAVLDTCKHLETQGFEVTYLNPGRSGLLDLKVLEAAIRPDTILLSIMQVNNETGVIQDIQAIGDLLKDRGIIFHVDAAQSAGKLPIDLQTLNVDLMSFSSHKAYGPKGIGALYVRRTPRVRIAAQMHGGGHERGMRSGTLATHQIVGMGEAFRIANERIEDDIPCIAAMRNHLWEGLANIGGIHLNGNLAHSVCGCLNVTIDDVDAERLLLGLKDIAISMGSACNSANHEPSHVLTAMGLSFCEASRTLRMSVGRFTSEAQIDYAIEHIKEQVTRLRTKAA